VTEPLAPPAPPTAKPPFRRLETRPDSVSPVVIVIALIPIALAAIIEILARGFLEPLLDDRVTFLGLPLIAPFLIALGVLTAVSALAARMTRNPIALGVVLFATTSLGVGIVVLAPALVLIAINLQT
jgi:hypothetical protein